MVFQTKGSATLFLPAVGGYLLILGERQAGPAEMSPNRQNSQQEIPD